MQVVISATDCIAEIVSNGGKDRAGAKQLVQCKFGIFEATSGVLSTKIVTSGACSWRRGTFGCPGSLSACKMMCARCRQICLFLAFSATCWRKSLTDGKVGWSLVTQSAEFGLCRHKRRDQSGLSCVPARLMLILQPSRDLACHCWLNHASVVCAYVRSVGSHCTRRGGGGGAALQLWAWGSVSAQIHFDKLVYADWYLESWCWMQASHWISCSYRWIMELHMSSSRGGWVVGLKAGVLYNHPAS